MKEKLDDIKLLNLIKLNIINCFSSKKFKLIFMILLFLPLLQFYLSCFKFYGVTNFNVMPSYNMGIINGVFFRKIIKLYIMTLPLVSSLLCSDCYYNDIDVHSFGHGGDRLTQGLHAIENTGVGCSGDLDAVLADQQAVAFRVPDVGSD